MKNDMSTINVQKLSYIIMIAVITSAILNPESLVTWAQNLPVNSWTDNLVEFTQQWHDWLEERGVTLFFDTLRQFLQSFREI
ncbi:MAG: hypothetical protein BWK79_12105 [Beggiatoa sp. IS2]|nr:MAG: hypothetical protein BWK79_12105 [Beggiatoa sp. IS2]